VRRIATLAATLAFALLLGCASTSDDHYTTADGDSGPLTVDPAEFDVARLGARGDAEFLAQMIFSIANNSRDDVTVKKISIRQRGITTIDLQSPAKAFDRTVPSGLSEDFHMEARVQVIGSTRDMTEKIRLAMIVEVLLTTGEAYEYTFDVPVDPGDVGR
jgi:hypothetical protein